MEQLGHLTYKTGHGSAVQDVRQASQGMWADAHRPGGLIRNEIQAQVLEAEIMALIHKDPRGAARAPIGKMMLSKYAWMMGRADIKDLYGKEGTEYAKKNNHYPYRFELGDILGPDVREIVEQLVCDEYFLGGPESSPYTPEAFAVQTMRCSDPFSTFERPDVTVEVTVNGKTQPAESYNGSVIPKPAFRDIK